jgi:hypothetical protein
MMEIVRSRTQESPPSAKTVMSASEMVCSDTTGEASRYLLDELTERYQKLHLLEDGAVKEFLKSLTQITENIEAIHNASNFEWDGKPRPTLEEANHQNHLLAQLTQVDSVIKAERREIVYDYAISKTAEYVRAYQESSAAPEAPQQAPAEESTYGQSTR